MPTRMSDFDGPGAEIGKPELALAGGVAVAFAAMAWTAWTMSPVLIMPVASLALLLAGFGLALAFWSRPSAERRLGYRDVAGLLVFLGFGAAMLSDGGALAALLHAAR